MTSPKHLNRFSRCCLAAFIVFLAGCGGGGGGSGGGSSGGGGTTTTTPPPPAPTLSALAATHGTWHGMAMATPAPVYCSDLLLLTDATVMCIEGWDGVSPSQRTFRLTPDIHGSYIDGTWSLLAGMHASRVTFASDVLINGKVYIAGAEDGGGGDTAEIYDTATDTWTYTAPPPAPIVTIGGSVSTLLPNGNVLQVARNIDGTEVLIYDPNLDEWSFTTGAGQQSEVSWIKLPDDSILTIDTSSQNSERYIPSLNSWAADAAVPVNVWVGEESGSAHLLPNGKVLWIGGPPVTAIYTPSGSVSPGSWAAGPAIPDNHGAVDAPAAMMANGKILAAMSLQPQFGFDLNLFGPNTYFYEYDYVDNSFKRVPGPIDSVDQSDSVQSNGTSMLDLPDGSVLYQGSDLYIYTPDGTPLEAGKSVISNIALNADGSYHLTGTGLNGISLGAAYGDDKQMNTNYPLVRLTDGATGNVYYARTYNWSGTGVMTGSRVMTTEFTLPAGLPRGTYSLVAVTNGIASAAVPFAF